MDDPTLASLRQALAASPDNLDLLAVVVQAYLDRDQPEEARSLLDGRAPDSLNDPLRRAAARACLKAGEAEEALTYATGDDPELLLLQARALAGLERREEAREAYGRAVAANPTLEDLDLKARLAARVTPFNRPKSDDGEERPKLTVIANDDTDRSELTRLLRPAEETVTFEDVGGLEAIKKQIHRKIILPFQKPSIFQRFKKRVGGGILLYGPPGCGKTLLARATAGECEAAFFNISIEDVLDMYIGESERKLAAFFEEARESSPSVVFFDELEALGGKRQYTREGTASKLVSQFLAEMDGFNQNNDGVLILGATNVPWAIDAAFRRPGRFDRVLFVPPPDRPARAAILEILLRERPIGGKIAYGTLAKATSGFSGADLKNLVETATDEAIEASLAKGEEIPISQAHLEEARKQVKPTTSEWLTTARNYARYANEAGQYDEVLDFLRRHGKR